MGGDLLRGRCVELAIHMTLEDARHLLAAQLISATSEDLSLLIMSAWMGMPLFQVDEMALMSLVGHLVYGLVLGLVFVAATGELASVPSERRTVSS